MNWATISAIVAALGGATGIAAIIKQLANAAETRAKAKKETSDCHQKQDAALAEIKEALATPLAALQAENEQLRAENNRLQKQNARLEGQVELLKRSNAERV
jgi:predicted nuclease with TOPRIM domain